METFGKGYIGQQYGIGQRALRRAVSCIGQSPWPMEKGCMS